MAHISIPDEDIVATFDVTDAEDTFPVSFALFAKADLRVSVDEDELAQSDFSFTGTLLPGGGYQGGTVVLDVAAENQRVAIWRSIVPQRASNFTPAQSVPIRDLDTALDRLQAQSQDAQRDIAQTIRYPVGRSGRVMPPAAQMASMLWASDLNGGLTFVPTIRGDDITTIDAASIFFDHNGRAEPRLMIDVTGQGSTIGADVAAGGFNYAVVGMQDDVDLVDDGVQRIFIASVFRGQIDGTPAITNKRSRFQMGINVRSEVDAVYVPAAGEVDAYYMPQEIGALSLTCTARAGTNRAKIVTLVVSAREEAGLDAASKGVAAQLITVRTTQGPDADDRSQITTGEDGDDGAELDEPTDEPTGGRQGSFTLRINAGTVKVGEQPVFGGWRSWCPVLISGRAGYSNGIVLGKKHSNGSFTDPEDVGGWGGVWGGRSWWHERTSAIYAKDGCPGWVTIGHDGIPDTGDSGAVAPLDIEVDLDDEPANWTGAVLAFNGDKLLATRRTGWTISTGTPSRGAWNADAVGALTFSATPTQAECNALRAACLAAFQRLHSIETDLTNHGLIGPTP